MEDKLWKVTAFWFKEEFDKNQGLKYKMINFRGSGEKMKNLWALLGAKDTKNFG